jgi:SHS2 domain-containing protein
MKQFEFFDHTADAEFKAYGFSMEEAFSNSALALVSCMFDLDSLSKADTKGIQVEGSDDKSLLYAFLEEILFILDTDSFITSEVTSMRIEGNKATAILSGCKMTPDRKTHGEVKAITYNSMEIGKEKDIYFVRVVVDM